MRFLCILILMMASSVAAEPVTGAAQALNALRAQQGLPPLVISEKLQLAAERHAQDMAQRGYFSHTGANGSDIAARAGAVGFRYCSLAENIAKGQKSLEAVMAGWAGSPGHRRNMLKRDVRVFGLARAKGNIWVMELGREGC
ncbi:hypothetical protein P775_17975 [Puniceibacterium antarcticum]|uniref:SCP domain-containing protein n=1 Tax=Puniceibacterium antarcticum TaxID=1206336 RepID=A0A2G8RAA5_9RHOB|nr:CAP domain-containing protein [Puniceibacterium antarcticum]PIL18462.1 hypothetical protein P775_17975 [Puniceibacterium antarcticum]